MSFKRLQQNRLRRNPTRKALTNQIAYLTDDDSSFKYGINSLKMHVMCVLPMEIPSSPYQMELWNTR